MAIWGGCAGRIGQGSELHLRKIGLATSFHVVGQNKTTIPYGLTRSSKAARQVQRSASLVLIMK